MIPPANFASLYDFAAIETAVQNYFAGAGGFSAPPSNDPADLATWLPPAGNIVILTAYQIQVFQKWTPRVGTFLSGINPISRVGHGIVDGNGAIRNNLWTANLLLEIITKQDYTYHTQTRNTVMALGEMIAPMVSDPTQAIGANPFLSQFQISYCAPQNVDTNIVRGDGFFGSQLNYQLTFCLAPQAIAAVTS
jgi:hypothetical protein